MIIFTYNLKQLIMKKLFNFNVLYVSIIIVLLFFKPTNYYLWILLIFQILIFFVHGKENFLKR
jgi:hypothetical protein